MESVGMVPAQPPASDQQEDPRFVAARAAGQGEEGREMLEHVRQGAELSPAEEKSGLDWLLGDPVAIPHEIPMQLETPDGMKEVFFIVRKSDPGKIDQIEQRHVDRVTGRIDQLAADTEIVATCSDAIRDGTRTVELTSPQFLTMRLRNTETGKIEDLQLASPIEALSRRLRGQQGVLFGVAREIRRVAGYDPTRVGQAQRALVEASLG